jgi:hypothetical protein
MVRAIAVYNSGTVNVATAGKEFAVRRRTLRIKAAEYNSDDNRCPVTCVRVSAWGLKKRNSRNTS